MNLHAPGHERHAILLPVAAPPCTDSNGKLPNVWRLAFGTLSSHSPGLCLIPDVDLIALEPRAIWASLLAADETYA